MRVLRLNIFDSRIIIVFTTVRINITTRGMWLMPIGSGAINTYSMYYSVRSRLHQLFQALAGKNSHPTLTTQLVHEESIHVRILSIGEPTTDTSIRNN